MIKEVIINYLPAFVLGFIFIFCTFRYMGTFKDMCDSIKLNSSYTKIEDAMKALLNENYDLKEELDKLNIRYNKKLAAEKKGKNDGVKKYNKDINKVHEKEMEFVFMSNVNKDNNEQQKIEEKENTKEEDKPNEQSETKQE